MSYFRCFTASSLGGNWMQLACGSSTCGQWKGGVAQNGLAKRPAKVRYIVSECFGYEAVLSLPKLSLIESNHFGTCPKIIGQHLFSHLKILKSHRCCMMLFIFSNKIHPHFELPKFESRRYDQLGFRTFRAAGINANAAASRVVNLENPTITNRWQVNCSHRSWIWKNRT